MLVWQSPTRTNAVLDALIDSVMPDVSSIHIAVAYVTSAGAKTLLHQLRHVIGDRWSDLDKAIVTCFDFGHTDPEALELLVQDGFEVRISNLTADGHPRLAPGPSSYHPKVYLFRSIRSANIVSGSANLSHRALSVNTEVVTAYSAAGDVAAELWRFFEDMSLPLTDGLLAEYCNSRPNQRQGRIPDEPDLEDEPQGGDLELFRTAVTNGDMHPEQFTAMWVEVLGMQGGAANQLELPRGAQRFFGFQFGMYDEQQRDIGEVRLTSGALEATRKLAWHGDNGMERINLPTVNQGGFEYAHRVLLFERCATAYEMTVEDADSPVATTWLKIASSAHSLYRVGANSPRRCGLI